MTCHCFSGCLRVCLSLSVSLHDTSLFQRLFAGVSVTVDGYMGSVNPVGGFQQLDVAVCTIEKANGLVNRLVRDDNISQLGRAVCPSLRPRHTLTDPVLVCTVLTYACLLAGIIGHRPRNATVSCPWPSSPSLSWCNPFLLFPFLCLFGRCFAV